MNIRIHSMKGLGDNIYQRAYVKALRDKGDIYIDTPWPELYSDLDINFIKPTTTLRTQQKNYSKFPDDFWSPEAPADQVIRFGYSSSVPVQSSMAALSGVDGVMDLPEKKPFFESGRPIALVRPVTIRKEWRNEARNPLPEYILAASDALSDTHCVISIADIQDGEEWLESPVKAEYRYESGELSVDQIISIVQSADVLVGGVGWIVPAAMAADKRALIVAGGNGMLNCPEKLSPGENKLTWAMPDHFCRCENFRHNCNKEISNFDQILKAFLCEK